jgi:hypothetical protein
LEVLSARITVHVACLIIAVLRRAVVRLHGYNQEIEVKQAELEASLGQEEIDLQIEQAAEDLVGSNRSSNHQFS